MQCLEGNFSKVTVEVPSKTVNVLITAIGGGGNGDQMLKSLLSVKGEPYVIYGTDSNPQVPQKSLVAGFRSVPMAGSDEYLNTIMSYCRDFSIDVVIPGSEAELKVLSKQREALAERGVLLLVNTHEVITICMDKELTNAKLSEFGYKCPRYSRIQSFEEIQNIEFFPAVVKPASGGGGSRDVFIVQDDRELRAICEYLGLGLHTESVFVQEYVGDPESEFTVGVLHDQDGKFVNSMALNRHLKGGLSVRSSVTNRTENAQLGDKLIISSGISQGRVDDFPEVTRQCEEIAEALGSRGPLNFQCRLVNGVVYIFEINPRFSGTSYMRAMLGFNEADLLIRHQLLGEKIQRKFAYKNATILRSLVENIVT